MFDILRVVSGIAKGLRLKTLDGDSTRPTKDMVKESVFNMISSNVIDAYVLDMYSGTGNLGIEALSRGAKHAVFFDSNKACCEIIRQNLEHTKLEENTSVFCLDSLNEASVKKNIYNKLDIVFLDPPYGKGLILYSIDLLQKINAFSKDVIIIAEHRADEEIPRIIGDFEAFKFKKYGKTSVTLYKYR